MFDMFTCSGVREEADGSVTYCLMGNGLTIVADEEYLTISSTLEPHHKLLSTTHSLTTNPSCQTSNSTSVACTSSTQNQNIIRHIPTTAVLPLSLSWDTFTTCPLLHPSQPLTTQPPKANPIQQGLLPSQYSTLSMNSQPAMPPPQSPPPPLTPITAQIISSVAPCTNPPSPTFPSTILPPAAQSHTQQMEEQQRREKEYKHGDDDDEDDEEESRRKASL